MEFGQRGVILTLGGVFLALMEVVLMFTKIRFVVYITLYGISNQN